MLKQSQCECNEIPRFRHRLTVQSPNEDAASDGHTDLADSGNWTTEGTIKARFDSRGGREKVNAEKVVAELNHVLETPSTGFSRGIKPRWRLVFQGRVINITAAYDVNEERRIVRIHATEKV